MQGKERNERPQRNNDEKRPTGNPGGMPNLRHQDVQDRQGQIRLLLIGKRTAGRCLCSRVRRNAFIQEFYAQLTPAAVAAGVNSYRPDGHICKPEKILFSL